MPVFDVSERGLLGKALRFPLRAIPGQMKMRVLVGPLQGKRWIRGSSIHRCWFGTYEYRKQKAFRTEIKPGDVVYDLGANVGFYSLLASVLAGPSGRVFSFEPVPNNIKYMRAHLDINGVKNCSVFEAAVGRIAGLSRFDEGVDGFTGRLRADVGPRDGMLVRTVVLDDLVRSGEIAPPNVIKCDIEGGEYNALIGASTTLRKYAPIVFLATHDAAIHQSCCQLLSSLGYELTALDDLPVTLTREILAKPPGDRSPHLHPNA
jgi:FkbM family methyltransferase